MAAPYFGGRSPLTYDQRAEDDTLSATRGPCQANPTRNNALHNPGSSVNGLGSMCQDAPADNPRRASGMTTWSERGLS